jgi:hypothetical protein
MRFSLVFPHTATDDPDAIPALARLTSYGRREDVDDADAAIAQMLGIAGAAAAPLAALGAGLDPGAAYVLRADPVTFVAGRDDVLLAGRVDDMTTDDAASLADTLNRHFASDGVAFHAPRADAWFATAREHVPVDTDALRPNEPIGAHLPRGAHAPRGGAGCRKCRCSCTSIPSTSGAKPRDSRLPPASGYRAAERCRCRASQPVHLRRAGRARRCRGRHRTPRAARASPSPRELRMRSRATGDALVVLATVDDDVERDWLSPSLAALERGTSTCGHDRPLEARARRITRQRAVVVATPGGARIVITLGAQGAASGQSEACRRRACRRWLARIYASRGYRERWRSSITRCARLPAVSPDARHRRTPAGRWQGHQREASASSSSPTYDADGSTRLRVGVRGLRASGSDGRLHRANRFEYGYGLTPEIVELGSAPSRGFIVTVGQRHRERGRRACSGRRATSTC